jgi:hypothetical protein
MTFDDEPQLLKEFGGALCVACAIAGRIVGRHLDEFGEESRLCLALTLEIRANIPVKAVVHGESDPGHRKSPS